MKTMGGSGAGRTTAGTLLLLAAVVSGCGESPVGVEGTCVAVANIDGVFMTTGEGVLAPDSVGTRYLTISRRTGCLDQGQASEPLAPGESNFLEVGTELHRVAGFAATERLAYRIHTGEWRTLTGGSTLADLTLAVGDEVAVDGSVLRVGLNRIVYDSRCPVDGTCVWAGDLEIEINLALGSGPTSPHRLHLNHLVGPTAVEFGGVRVRLASVEPTPRSTITIPESEYRARLVVEAVPAS